MLYCSVYGLSSSEDGRIRYIGQTKQALRSRLVQHLAEAARPPGTSRCHRWIRKVIRSGHTIEIHLIESDCEWNIAEMQWIARFRDSQPDLMTNLSDGGCGYAGRRTEEVRMKMRKPKSEAHREKMRKPKSAETRKRMSEALKGNIRGKGQNNGQAVLTESVVIDIKDRLKQGQSLSEIGKLHGVTKATIWKIKAGYSWSHVA